MNGPALRAAESDQLRLKFSHGPRAAQSDALADGAPGEVLIAYLHVRRGTPPHAKAELEKHIRAFAARERYDLQRLLIGVEGGSDVLTLRSLVEHVEVAGASKVLIVGPARQALVTLHRMSGVKVVTLAQVRPREGPAHPPNTRKGSQ